MKVGVVGFGMMGRQIAQVFAQHGHEVRATDENQQSLRSGLDEIENGPYGTRAAVTRGKLSAAGAAETLSRIKTVATLAEACVEADLVVEAVFEDLELKRRVFREIETCAPSTARLASNTSTLPLKKIAEGVKQKGRVIGLHFFNPAQATRLVEVIRSEETTPDAASYAVEIVRHLDKTPIIARDEPGFVANRLGLSLFQEASRLHEDGVAGVKDIDTAMKLGYGHAMGPFQTADMVGLDTRIRNLESLFQSTGDQRWLASKTLRGLVNEGYLGDPSRRPGSKGGYYRYFNLEY